MGKRASAVAATRRRIIDATRELHGEQGIAATSWDDIAARAGVGVGTVYRHFPSADELLPACGQLSMEIIALPSPSEVFEGAASAPERIERLVREVFGVYERGAPQLWAMRNEAEAHPSVAAAGEAVEASLGEMVAQAASPERRAVLRAMVDLGTWQALRDQGLEPEEAASAVTRMLVASPG